MNKFRAVKTVVDGITFDSKAEARRYGSLKMLEKGKRITRLELQPRFKLYGKNGGYICEYRADFQYFELDANGVAIGMVIEDVKSPVTAKNPVYRLKVKLLKDNQPGLDFREVS